MLTTYRGSKQIARVEAIFSNKSQFRSALKKIPDLLDTHCLIEILIRKNYIAPFLKSSSNDAQSEAIEDTWKNILRIQGDEMYTANRNKSYHNEADFIRALNNIPKMLLLGKSVNIHVQHRYISCFQDGVGDEDECTMIEWGWGNLL